MKKYLLPTIAIVALAGCGSATKVASGGTIEDRRTPMTVSSIAPVPTTEATVEYADLWESTDADSELLTGMLSDIADAMDAVSTDYDTETMKADCLTGAIATAIAYVEVETYTGPNATALNKALDEYGIGFMACSKGDFETGANHIARGNVLLEAANAAF